MLTHGILFYFKSIRLFSKEKLDAFYFKSFLIEKETNLLDEKLELKNSLKIFEINRKYKKIA